MNKLTGKEIKYAITQNNRKIKECADFSKGVLNYEVAKLIQSNRDLQSMCEHDFEEGNYCIYCGISKTEVPNGN